MNMRVRSAALGITFTLAVAGGARTESALPVANHYPYGMDVFFAFGSSNVDLAQSESIVAKLKRPREVAPNIAWCAVLLGYADGTEGDASQALELAKLRAASVKDILLRYGLSSPQVVTEAVGTGNALFQRGDARNARVEIEQVPCSEL